MQSYYIMNPNGQSYCVFLEYRDFKIKYCAVGSESYTRNISKR